MASVSGLPGFWPVAPQFVQRRQDLLPRPAARFVAGFGRFVRAPGGVRLGVVPVAVQNTRSRPAAGP